MPTTIITGEANIAVSYRLNFPNGQRFKVMAIPLDTRTATQVLGSVTEDYTLIVPLRPPGIAWPFLREFKPQASYVQSHTGIQGAFLGLLTLLIPILTTIPPADDILTLAEDWYNEL